MENTFLDKLPTFEIPEPNRYELTKQDIRWARIYSFAPFLAPILTALPLPLIFLVLMFLFGSTPPIAFIFFFLTIISLIVSFIIGIIVGFSMFVRGRKWKNELREKLAADGIKTNEVDWFTHELSSAEKRSLKDLGKTNRLLADAFHETLASRLTASRIIKSTKNELQLVQRRQNKLKYLKQANTDELTNELKGDAERLTKIQTAGKELLDESKMRLEMIEAAARRGTSLADTETALKRLTERSAELPLALEAAKMEEETRKELENEAAEVWKFFIDSKPDLLYYQLLNF